MDKAVSCFRQQSQISGQSKHKSSGRSIWLLVSCITCLGFVGGPTKSFAIFPSPPILVAQTQYQDKDIDPFEQGKKLAKQAVLDGETAYRPQEWEVSDTDSGIAPEELGALFNPFVQTETGRKSQSGTGLGLPISQKFVELMSGEIGVTSQPGKGTTFKFDIQVRRDFPQQSQTPTPTRKVMGLAPDQPKYRLLVVDDVKVSRLLLVKMIRGLRFEVREAENGREAIALWSTWEPHLIFMDIQMPVMDGYKATKRIKAHLEGEKTAIVALTASAFEE